MTMPEFTDLDDVGVNHCFKLWIRSDDVVLSRLCRGLLFRGLYKTIDLSHLPNRDDVATRLVRAEEAVQQQGGDPAYDLFYDEPADTPYDTYSPDDGAASEGIMIRDPAGKLTRFSLISPLPRALNERLMFRRIHVAAQYRDTAAAAALS
jgi:HD superfamily phosphohydrolase